MSDANDRFHKAADDLQAHSSSHPFWAEMLADLETPWKHIVSGKGSVGDYAEAVGEVGAAVTVGAAAVAGIAELVIPAVYGAAATEAVVGTAATVTVGGAALVAGGCLADSLAGYNKSKNEDDVLR